MAELLNDPLTHIPQKESMFTLMYGTEALSYTDFYPPGRLRAWLEADKRLPLPPYISADEHKVYQQIFEKLSYRGPTNWYKLRFRDQLGIKDEQGLPAELTCPTLYVAQAETSVVDMPFLWTVTAHYAATCVRKRASTRGHWVQLEARDEVNAWLEEFLEEYS